MVIPDTPPNLLMEWGRDGVFQSLQIFLGNHKYQLTGEGHVTVHLLHHSPGGTLLSQPAAFSWEIDCETGEGFANHNNGRNLLGSHPKIYLTHFLMRIFLVIDIGSQQRWTPVSKITIRIRFGAQRMTYILDIKTPNEHRYIK